MSSIFVFSQNQGRCVELEIPDASSSDLDALNGALPSNISGLSFSRPELAQRGQGAVKFHSVSSPNHVAGHLATLGDRMLQAAQPLAALRFYDLSVRLRPDSISHLRRADALLNLGRVDDAKAESELVLKNNPRNASALLLRGRVELQKEHYSEAVSYFRNAVLSSRTEEEKESALAYARFAKIYQDRDQLHLKDLSPQDYVFEIEQLQSRVRSLRGQIQASEDPTLQGMATHLDALDNLFSNWLRELSA